MGIHPFAMQCVFRRFCTMYQQQPLMIEPWARLRNEERLISLFGQGEDTLSSFTKYQSHTDANALAFVWPQEFDQYFICLITITDPNYRANGLLQIRTCNLTTFWKEVWLVVSG